MERPTSMPALDGLAIEAVEWLPSGSDAGLVRVRGRWSDTGRREQELPALVVRRAGQARRFESLPDARFSREPSVWRATYLVPAALMEPRPEELSLAWESGAGAVLPAPERGFEPPPAPPGQVPEPEQEPGGEVIDRAVMAERRARRAEAAERAQAERAAEALKAVEVLELRSAELERRLEALQAERPAGGDESAVERDADRAGPVADAAVAPADAPAPDLPRADPRAEALTAAIATVKRLQGELGEQRRRLRRSELLRGADAVALASLREGQGRVSQLERQLSASRAELAQALAAADRAAAEASAAREQAAEQVARAQRRAAADAAAVRASAAEELAAIADELTRMRSVLASVRRHAAERGADLERRLTELDKALATERRAHSGTVSERDAARALLAAAEATNHAEAVARAALEQELDRERAVRATLTATLASERGELMQARSELASARSELASARARIAELERGPRSAGAPATGDRGALLGRVGAGERSAGEDRGPGARELAPVTRPAAAGDQRAFAAKLDAAAAELRARSPREPAADRAAAGHEPGALREYPRLRTALVRLAHEDPRAAARLMLALAPAQHALVPAPLDYDLTIRGTGTYAISIGSGRVVTRAIREPRARDQAAFHVLADAAILAEVLAGVQKRVGRWIGSVRVSGRRRDAVALREALVAADLDLAAAARAGADIDPDLVWRALAYAIDPAWTVGHSFTVAQEVTSPRPVRWHIGVHDGAPVTVEGQAPARPPDAVVSMSRSAFTQLLRAEPVAAGDRPAIRGDRAAVAALMRWTDRAQGRAG